MAGERYDPMDREIELLIRQDLSPAAQSEALAAFARETHAEVAADNAAALGHPVTSETIVDGTRGAKEDRVRPTGTIVYDFELVDEVFAWIAQQLDLHSPIGKGRDDHPGRYRRSHIFLADGVEADPRAIGRQVEVGVFVNSVPYARKIEDGESPQQPDGVYQVVTALASRRFGNIARIQFGYRSVSAGSKRADRNPAIIVTVR